MPDQPANAVNIMGEVTPGLQLVAGSNSLLNEAGILDYNPHSTLMVLGDAYQTNAIFQLNVLQDSANISYDTTLPNDLVSIVNGNDQLNNYATFHNYDVSALTGAASAQFGWHVEVEQGNFYNVSVAQQINVMVSGDVSYQTTDSSYYQAVTGANHQYNGMLLDSEGQPFDLVVALGNYHNANIIDQTNVVLNTADVKALLTAENATGFSISSGGNMLLNEADISNYGPSGLLPMSTAMAEHAQNAQSGTFDPSLASQVPGHGPLNVLFVTGDYYDINIVSQTNVLSNNISAAQLLLNTTPYATSSTESISTGANQAINAASITDVGTIGSQYVAGNQYSDSLLLQANILTDTTAVHPVAPNALVNEVVAFLDHSTAAAIPTNIDIPGTGASAQHDFLTGALA